MQLAWSAAVDPQIRAKLPASRHRYIGDSCPISPLPSATRCAPHSSSRGPAVMRLVARRVSWGGASLRILVTMIRNPHTPEYWLLVLALGLTGQLSPVANAERRVPGSGTRLDAVGDNFEDETWRYVFNLPKSTIDLDQNSRTPTGIAANDRWYEGVKRGQPDTVRRVPTPAGGLSGSHGSLLLQSCQTGIPGHPSYQMQQDDFIADVHERLDGWIPVAREPSAVVRVFLPRTREWENRTGPHFAFRVAVTHSVQSTALFGLGSRKKAETFWPGMFIDFESKTDGTKTRDYAQLRLRADADGDDFLGIHIPTTGWWTLGISCTRDGQIHYYARPGVEPLTARDHLASNYSYGYQAEHFKTFFFNVCSGDDGHTWSTPWIIDDPSVFALSGNRARTARRNAPRAARP